MLGGNPAVILRVFGTSDHLVESLSFLAKLCSNRYQITEDTTQIYLRPSRP
jgi:hypothetical protein